jgi:hypothetical protein
MKKLILLFSVVLCLASCGTYTGQGAAVGSYTGSILGSAIGGIIGGPRGSDIGTIIGMAGGAAVGASVGAAADQQVAADYQGSQNNEQRSRQQDDYRQGSSSQGDGNYTPGDDRINMYNDDAYSGNYSAAAPRSYAPSTNVEPKKSFSYTLNPALEIVNLRFVDANRDKSLNAGEECKIIFEVMNRSNSVLYDVQPIVVETTGNRHVYVSPNIHVESIQPGSGIRYTAMVKADNRLKEGSVIFHVSAMQGNGVSTSKINEIEVPTSRM